MFIVNRQFSFSKVVAVPEAKALEAIRPEFLITASPLVVKYEAKDPSQPDLYTISERLPVLGIFETVHTFTSLVTQKEDGVESQTNAQAYTTMNARWRAVKKDEDQTEVREDVSVSGLFFLMPYIVYTARKAHQRVFWVTGTCLMLMALSIFIQLLVPGFVMVTFWLLWPRKSSDPYGLFHLSLNRLPNDDPRELPKTEWLNMGFWKDVTTFPDACQALAKKLIQAAQIKHGARVLDVGHGTGESLIFLLSNPSVNLISSLTGITSLTTHHNRSLERLSQIKVPKDTEINLYEGDAVYRSGAVRHPLDPNSHATFDAILALDCAYHFKTRDLFLRQSFEHLAPGGRIALADICLDAAKLEGWKRLLMFSVFAVMPEANGIAVPRYIEQLEKIGFVDVIVEDISEDVFPGFVAFLKGRGFGWRVFGWMMEWLYASGAKFVIASGQKSIKVVAVPEAKALEVIRPEFLITASPLVVKYEVKDPSQPDLYTISERLPVLGIFETVNTFTSLVTQKEDGVESQTNAQAYTTMNARWRAVKKDEDQTEVREDVSVSGIFFLMPYIVYTARKAHQRVFEKLIQAVEEKA
ncbi:hypothetical protein D9758_000224 [Tetrapyrgos nigripes]|uniref:phosphoethanolamine N-methyltransferase n=1 Tax=Tetrapyrgos nigripes TaxID=182062 RepID=A0A8H5LYP5_9AGAR|nr:hypothetical protein D9758_000224 [Tetrapyrgos nigripes]